VIEYYEHIDDYIDGRLSSEARQAFEDAMKTDASLKLAVENYMDAAKLSEGLLEMDIMETINNFKNKSQEKIDYSTSKSKKWLWFVLLATVLALSIFWYINDKESTLHQNQILATYIRPNDDDATKSMDTIGMTTFQKGKYFFQLNRFEESEEWLKKFVSTEKDKNLLSEGYYWLGAAQLEQWELDDAEKAWSQSHEAEAVKNVKLLKHQ